MKIESQKQMQLKLNEYQYAGENEAAKMVGNDRDKLNLSAPKQ